MSEPIVWGIAVVVIIAFALLVIRTSEENPNKGNPTKYSGVLEYNVLKNPLYGTVPNTHGQKFGNGRVSGTCPGHYEIQTDGSCIVYNASGKKIGIVTAEGYVIFSSENGYLKRMPEIRVISHHILDKDEGSMVVASFTGDDNMGAAAAFICLAEDGLNSGKYHDFYY